MVNGVMDLLDNANLSWFALVNADAGVGGWRLMGASFAATWLILLVPASLAGLWMSGRDDRRKAAVAALAAVACALLLNALIGMVWYHARPFAIGVGHAFLRHAPTSSFPSNHATIMFTTALVLASSGVPSARRIGLCMLPLASIVAWARVFAGVHWPLDMAGGIVMALCMTRLFGSAAARTMTAALSTSLAKLYRAVLAKPIRRGWLRP